MNPVIYVLPLITVSPSPSIYAAVIYDSFVDPCDSNDHDAGVPRPHALRGLLVEQEPARSHLCRYTGQHILFKFRVH